MNLALVELHDVSPYYRGELSRALELLEEVGLHRFTLLVVPHFWEIAPLEGDTYITGLLKDEKVEVALHGYTHRGKKRLQNLLWTDGEGEFGGLDLSQTYQKVQKGVETLERLGLRAEVFVPPAWIGNPYLEDVLYSLGFAGVAYRWHIKDLNSGRVIKVPAITFSNRSFLSWLSLKVVPKIEKRYVSYPVVRFAIHMADFRDRRKIDLWREILNKVKNTRRLTSYGEILGKGRPSPSFKSLQPAGGLV